MEAFELHLERGRKLLELRRIKEASAELKKAFSIHSEDVETLYLLSVCAVNEDNKEEAKLFCEKLLAVAPNLALSHYMNAQKELLFKNDKAAELSIREAIQIDPSDADFWSILSSIYISRKEWQLALDYANNGLNFDPEHSNCLNHRALCLTKLDQKDALHLTIEDALLNNPHDSYTHSNVGWSKLELGDHKAARTHFVEALRLNPNSEHARLGLLESVKAKNPLYRIFLSYYFFISKYQTTMQYGILIAFFLGGRFLNAVSESFPALSILYYLFLAFVFLTWVISPIINLTLLFDPMGKHVLNREEKRGAFVAALTLIPALLCFVFAILQAEENNTQTLAFSNALIFFGLGVVGTRYFQYDEYEINQKIKIFTTVFTLMGVISLVQINFLQASSIIFTIFVYALVAYTWVGDRVLR